MEVWNGVRRWCAARWPGRWGGYERGDDDGDAAGWSRGNFERFVHDRAGNGKSVVHWSGRGSLVDLQRGVVVTALESLESIRLVDGPRACSPHERCDMQALLSSKKIIFYTDKNDGSFNPTISYLGRSKDDVAPLQYPKQLTRLVLRDGRVELISEPTTHGPSVAAQPARNRAFVSAPAADGFCFIDFLHSTSLPVRQTVVGGPVTSVDPTTSPSYIPPFYEKYDYFLRRSPARWAWSRHGRCPAWFGGTNRSQCVLQLRGERVQRSEHLRPDLLQHLQKEHPEYLEAPEYILTAW